MPCRRLAIRGRVQGVSFRDWTVATARALGLAGWVRNRRDGSVEALACGTADQLKAFAAACRQGPAGARVDAMDMADAPDQPLDGFTRRPTE